MSTIRGRHISPGIYTKNTTKDYSALKTFNKVRPKDTRNVNAANGSGSFLKWLYFGYFKIKTVNGKIDENSLERLRNLTYDELLDLLNNKKVIRTRTPLSNIEPYKDEELNIEITLTEKELNEKIDNGERLEDILDDNNNCNIIVLPTKITKSDKFKIIDTTFNYEITNLFEPINVINLNGQEYQILCFFGDHWCYSSVGKTKIISPFKIEF